MHCTLKIKVMKNLILKIVVVSFVVSLLSSCSGAYTCPTYAKHDITDSVITKTQETEKI